MFASLLSRCGHDTVGQGSTSDELVESLGLDVARFCFSSL